MVHTYTAQRARDVVQDGHRRRGYGNQHGNPPTAGKTHTARPRQETVWAHQVFVVQGLNTNLLGLPAITALQIIARVDATESESQNAIFKQFPKVFEGLGNLGEEFEVKLKTDANPHALFTPRNVPLPLRPQVQQELLRMESMGVISKVDEPTPWCAGMVPVPKTGGRV